MQNEIFKKEYFILDSKSKTQDEVFNEIAKLAIKHKIISNENKLVELFKNRELEGSTGVEDGFAIPHARDKQILKNAVIFVKFKNGIEWNSIDNKKIKIAIALIVKDEENNNDHLKILSSLAVKLVDEKNRKILKEATDFKIIENILFKEDKKQISSITKNEINNNENNKRIVAITGCPTGVAHTYMAAEKLTKKGIELGYTIKVETHGSSGVGNQATEKEIEKADIIIIAADVGIETSRFVGKKVYFCRVARAIKEPQLVISDAFKEGIIQEGKKSKSSQNNNKTGIMQHLMAGVSYMIPMIIVGGICLALAIGLTKIIYGVQWVPGSPGTPGSPVDHILPGNHFLSYLNGIGAFAFALMIPILGGFIANSIGGRAAIAPAMLASFVGNDPKMFFPIGGITVQTPTGFLGAIAVGLAVGFLVKWINTWKVPKNLRPIMPLFVIPIGLGVTGSFLLVYVIGAPIGWVMEQFQHGIKNILGKGEIGVGVALGMGLLIGGMMGFDLGGPINKVAFLTCAALVTQKIYQPMGMAACSGAVAPLGMAFCTFFFRRLFDEEERNTGISALIMGLIGITEGAIPFAVKDPKRAIPCNVLGSAVAGGLGGAMTVTNYAAHTGPIVVILGAVPYGIDSLYAIIAITIGAGITCFTYGFWSLAAAKKGKKEIYILPKAESKFKIFKKNRNLNS